MIQIAVLSSSLAEMVSCGDSGTDAADVGGLEVIFLEVINSIFSRNTRRRDEVNVCQLLKDIFKG